MTDTCPRCLAVAIPPARTRQFHSQTITVYVCTCGHKWTVARNADAYAPPPECPTPGKHRYATREAALRAADRSELPIGHRLHPYPCRCGWLHLSKLAPPEQYRDPAA